MADSVQGGKCPSCGAECEEAMNFCSACGARLMVISPAVSRMIEDYRSRLANSPKDANAHYNLALAYLEAKDERLAEEELRRVIELEPEFADAYVRLARLYLGQGKQDAAKSELERALKVAPDDPTAKRLMDSIINPR